MGSVLLVLLMSFTITGASIWAISNRSGGKNKVFRFTSFEDEDHVRHIFLVYAPNLKLAQKDAAKMIMLNDLEIHMVEELDKKSWSVIDTPYSKKKRGGVKVEKI